MKPLILSLLTIPALAQIPVISGVTVDYISHTAARVNWTTNTGQINNEVRFAVSPVAPGTYVSPRKTALQATITNATNASPIQITTSAAHGYSTGNPVQIGNVLGNTAANGTWTVTKVDATHFTLNGSTGNGAYTSGGWSTLNPYTAHAIVLTGLAPATTYNYAVCSGVGTQWETCSASASFTTNAAPPNRFADPAPPAGVPAPALPAITGSTFTVAGDCSDLQAQLNNAGAANASLNHQVLLPPGVECIGNYNLPAKTGTGVVVVRPSTPDDQLPPARVRLTSDWPDSRLGIISNPTGYPPTMAGGVNTPSNTKGWYFYGIKLTNAYRAADYLTVTNATNTSPIQITTSTPHGYSTGNVIQIGGITGNTAANRYNWKITVIDTTNFTLNGSTGNGAYTSGGWVTKDPPSQKYMFYNGAATISNITFDRCRIQGRDYPTRTMYGIYFGPCTTCAAINSEFKNLGEWQALDPDGPSYPVTLIATSLGVPGTAISIDDTLCHSCLFENNLIGTAGISVFAQSPTAISPPTSDIVVRRNTFRWDTAHKLTGGPTAGVYWVSRQPLEFKRGVRLLITGNEFDSTWTNGVTGNYPSAILLAPHPSDAMVQAGSLNSIGDVTLTYNYLHGVPNGITVGGSEYYSSPTDNAGVTARVLVRHNVFGLDGANLSQSNFITSTYIGAGAPFYFYSGLEDYRIEHNTVFSQIGKYPGILPMDYAWGSGLRFADNLMLNGTWVGGSPISGNPATGLSPGFMTTTALTRVQTQLTATPGTPDPASVLAGNVMIPGVTDATNPANYGNTTKSWSVANCNTYWTGFIGQTCLGADATTANQKIATVGWLDSSGDFTLRPSSPVASGARSNGDRLDAGADWGAVQAAMGYVRNVRVLSIGRTTATVAYTRPGDVACVVEYGVSSSFGTGTRVTDTSAILASTAYVPVTVTLSGLQPATSYNYRVLCPASQPSGLFSTLP